MSESAFTTAVIELGQLFGWKVAHFRPSRTESGWRTALQGDAGFPDVTLARRGRVIFAELKARNGYLRAEQRAWADALQTPLPDPCVRWYLWRPDDLPEIAEILR